VPVPLHTELAGFNGTDYIGWRPPWWRETDNCLTTE